MSTKLYYYKQNGPDSSNVVLYHCDVPVIVVEQRTTLQVAKLLFESIVGRGKIIGLRQRRKAPAVACIITQDQTILTEQEYEIILNEKPVERGLEKESIVFHDPRVNIPLKPGIQIWPPRFLNSRQIVQEARFGSINEMQNKAKIVSTLSPRRDQECDNNNETSKKRANTEGPPFPVTKSFENETGRKKARIDFEVKKLISATDSTFPSTAIADHEHSGIPSQNSPVQIISLTPSAPQNWQCFYCEKNFVSRNAYECHERTHTKEKPFECGVCGRCFSLQGNLKQHMHIHRDVKPHVCDVCGRGFTRFNRLRDHKRGQQCKRHLSTPTFRQAEHHKNNPGDSC